MSLASVRPLFRTRLNALGFKEHFDAFDEQNVPQHELDMAYQLESGPVASAITGPTVFEFDFSVTVKIFLAGGRNNVDLVDRAFEVSDTVMADLLNPDVRLGTDVKNILPDSITVEPYTGSDDNDLILSLGYTGKVICTY